VDEHEQRDDDDESQQPKARPERARNEDALRAESRDLTSTSICGEVPRFVHRQRRRDEQSEESGASIRDQLNTDLSQIGT